MYVEFETNLNKSCFSVFILRISESKPCARALAGLCSVRTIIVGGLS